jgi:hemerythrin superfamily protein
MKATTLLERQHANILSLCEALDRAMPSIRESLLPQLAGDLAAHMRIEEELFYPALARHGVVMHGVEHHRLLRLYLQRAMEEDPRSQAADDRIAELRELLVSHIDEEERDLFPRAVTLLGADESRALAVRLMRMHSASIELGYRLTPAPAPAAIIAR